MSQSAAQTVIDCASSGAIAVFDEMAAVDADVIVKLARQRPPPPSGVRIAGARIEGGLDLSDCDLRALALEGCEITGPIDLTGAVLGRLSLRNSRFCGLVLRGAKVDGLVDVSFASPLDAEARIDARNARILGGMVGEGLRLKSPPPRPKDQVLAWAHNWALDLTEAKIERGCMLYGDTVIDGGISLDSTHIEGGLSLRGAHVIAGEGDSFHPGDAIRGPNVQVDGDVHMNFGFQAQGRMFMLGAKIGNRLSISGKLTGATEGYDWAGRPGAYTSAALQVDYLSTGAGFLLYDSEVEGQVGFNNASIGKNVSFSGTVFRNAGAGSSSAIVAENTRVGTAISFGAGGRKAASVEGVIVLCGAQIGGVVDLRGAGLAAESDQLDATGLSCAKVLGL